MVKKIKDILWFIVKIGCGACEIFTGLLDIELWEGYVGVDDGEVVGFFSW